MASVELRNKTELTVITGTENIYVQEAGSPFTVKRTLLSTIRAWLKTYFDGLYATIGGAISTYYAQASYAILDGDGYGRIEVDTTAGAVTITLPLMANNRGRRIEIAFIKADASADVVTILPHATDANKLSNDLLGSIILSKVGDFLIVQESVNSGCWEVVNERITSQLRLNTYAGYGSTDNKIMRFTNVVENVGNMFSENHVSGYSSNAKGLEITVNRSGRYGVSFYSRFDSSSYIGLSLNSSQLTTGVDSITTADRLGVTLCETAGDDSGLSSVLYLKKNDVLRTHTGGAANSGATARTFMSVTYIGQ